MKSVSWRGLRIGFFSLCYLEIFLKTSEKLFFFGSHLVELYIMSSGSGVAEVAVADLRF